MGLRAGDNVTTKRQVRASHPWPFKAAPTLHDYQTSIEGVGVPRAQEIEFKDGTRIQLRRVMRDNHPHLFLRELGDPAAGTLVDLRALIKDEKLALDAAKELPITSTRDVAHYVHQSLRLRFPTRDAFIEEVVRLGRPE